MLRIVLAGIRSGWSSSQVEKTSDTIRVTISAMMAIMIRFCFLRIYGSMHTVRNSSAICSSIVTITPSPSSEALK